MEHRLSRRAYARHRGVSEAAVRKAITAGRIAVEPDGTIDPTVADVQWQQNSGRRTAAKRADANAPVVAAEDAATRPHPVSREAVASVLDTLAEAGCEIGEFDAALTRLRGPDVTLNEAQVAKTIVEAHLKRLQVLEKRRKLIDRDKAEAYAFELARRERDAWLAWPARIAPQFAAEVAAMETVDQRGIHALLEQYVHEHLEELGDLESRRLA